MNRILYSIAAITFLSSCNTPPSSSSFVGPSGTQIYSTKCKGAPDGCYQEARLAEVLTKFSIAKAMLGA